MKLKKLETIVFEVLNENENARINDFILYGSVLKKMNISLNIRLRDFLVLANRLKAPIFESVTRCRRKIQSKYPNLKNGDVAKLRQIEQKKYIEFSK